MALMLIDTPDPRYRHEPEPDRTPSWRPNMRVWTPIAASVACFLVAYLVPPLVTFLLTIVGLVLFFDGVLSLLPAGDGLHSHRQ